MARQSKSLLKNLKEEADSSFELDLAPMLALMVTLIPVMLLSTVFVRVTVIETKLPQVVQELLEQDRKKKKRDVSINLDMSNKGFALKILVDGKVHQKKLIPKRGNTWDLKTLHYEVVRIKRRYPKIFRLNVLPNESVAYEDIVKVMDEVRNVKDGDPKLFVRDEKTNKNVELELMFPDVVFSNVIDG